jgi:hypothetical protein
MNKDLHIPTASKRSIKGHSKKKLDSYYIIRFNQEEKLDAKMLNYLFMRLDNEQIPYDKRFFAIDLRSDESKRKLLALKQNQFQRIKGALSPNQIKFYSNRR